MGSALVGQTVKLGIAPSFRFLPVGSNKTAIFQSMQCGIQGTARHLNNVAGDLLESPRDSIAVRRLHGDNFQDQQI
jgi:hypothetical protein